MEYPVNHTHLIASSTFVEMVTGDGWLLTSDTSKLPCCIICTSPLEQKKNGLMDHDDFRACLISMGYDLVGNLKIQ